jgi:hypothetical protein
MGQRAADRMAEERLEAGRRGGGRRAGRVAVARGRSPEEQDGMLRTGYRYVSGGPGSL